MHTAYLLIGGNLGNREHYLSLAIELIQQQAAEPAVESAIYETAAWGNTHQPAFLNKVVCIKTKQTAADLMTGLLQIEQVLGRTRGDRYGSRTIDIDILFYGAEIYRSGHITIPHPEIENRRFALVPMVELAPNLVHPVLLKTMKQLLQECADKLEVKKI
jgi:2-amino-4-hydroxy-6-hydroxymethyldihydropteridine diphosphokinase